MVSAEMAPFAKVGGLADVTDALSRALVRRGHDVRVVLPLYGQLDREREKIRPLKKLSPLSVRVGQRVYEARIHVRGSASAAVKIYLVSCDGLYGRQGIYTDAKGIGFADSIARAALHGQVALQLPRLLDWPVDIVHAHDAEAASALLYRRHWYAGQALPGPAGTLLTIHNLAHQEIHGAEAIETLGLPRAMASYPGLLEFHGDVNLLKGGILSADRVNTVSPTYAAETRQDAVIGCGLEGVLLSRGTHYSGLLNGADYETWDPRRDAHLPARYGPDDLAGKARCRDALLAELKLAPTAGKPVCGFVSRLVTQKGIDLLLPVLRRLADDGFAFAILGTGERRLHEALRILAKAYPRNIAFCETFNEPLAHRIYAGSDLFLMPSEFEPCGLSQMYAMRYGTPPLVRRTGGLADTVIDAGRDAGTGFVFKENTPESLLAALRRAADCFVDEEAWPRLQARGMAAEFSWDRAAEGYEALYKEIGGATV